MAVRPGSFEKQEIPWAGLVENPGIQLANVSKECEPTGFIRLQ